MTSLFVLFFLKKGKEKKKKAADIAVLVNFDPGRATEAD